MAAEGDYQNLRNISEIIEGTVSTVHQCQSKDARYLLLSNVGFHKLRTTGFYGIGGTNTDSKPDLWFFFTTKICPGLNMIINLFVCHRNVGPFKVSVSNSSDLSPFKSDKVTQGDMVFNLPHTLTTKLCMSNKIDENHYLATYYCTLYCLRKLEKCKLLIPIKIEMNPKNPLSVETVKRVKCMHNIKKPLTRNDPADFFLKSSSGKVYPVHKIVAAANSPVLLQEIKCAQTSEVSTNISDDEMELLLQFIYTGAIENIVEQDCSKLIEVAKKFQIQSLLALTQVVLLENINVKNAIDLASVAVKYNLPTLKINVFKFIATKKEVLETDQWKNLEDVQLAKELAQFMSRH